MTTPAKPERMTSEAFTDLCAALVNRGIANQDTRDVLTPLVGEAVRARAEESRLTRELALSERLIDAFARELGTLVCQVMAADGRAGGYRESARRLCDYLGDVLYREDTAEEELAEVRKLLGPSVNIAEEVAALAEERDDLRKAVEQLQAERDAAREEAKRLRLMLNGTPETCATAACDKPSVRGGYCFDCYHADE